MDGVPLPEPHILGFEVGDEVVVHVRVHEPPESPLVVQNPVGQPREVRRELRKDLRQSGATYIDRVWPRASGRRADGKVTRTGAGPSTMGSDLISRAALRFP